MDAHPMNNETDNGAPTPPAEDGTTGLSAAARRFSSSVFEAAFSFSDEESLGDATDAGILVFFFFSFF
jgi:hypothetical protein